jgi:C-methyltransferase
MDWPNVLKFTRENATRFGVHDRTRFIEGDIFEVPFGGPYDLAILSGILHHFSEEREAELLSKVAGALKPDGRLVIHEFVVEGEPRENPMPLLFSVLMLVWTREGESPSLSQLERMLKAAGLGSPTMHEIPGLPSQIVIADRLAV